MIKYSKKEEIEKRLINNFRRTFYKRLGYYPIVSTQVIQNDSVISIMSLNELEQHFAHRFPYKFGKHHNLRSNGRYRELIDLRIIFTQIARTMNYTYQNIGQYLGGKHHTTVLNYAVLFRNLMETSEPFRELYTTIFNHIKEKTKHESSNLESLNQTQCEPQSDLFS
jgi:chromosomal replication initiation ATPase DnaA